MVDGISQDWLEEQCLTELDFMTDEEVMERCRRGRELMQKTEMAVFWLTRVERDRNRPLEMTAFLEIFHPDLPDSLKLECVQEARRRQDEDRRGRHIW